MKSSIKIALAGTPHDYVHGVIPRLITQAGYRIDWSSQKDCDLIIYGPFYKPSYPTYRWLPKPVRPAALRLHTALASTARVRKHQPLRLFQTGESVRHNHINADFSLSFDLAIQQPNHLRFPYWWELVDWSYEGITGNQNPRFGELLSLDALSQPLGYGFLNRPRRAAMITSHLLEPRATLLSAVRQFIPVDGYGKYFQPQIANHHQSSFTKRDLLRQYAFNLCPENQLYPGYYTEKIPEAFLAGCLPLTWADSNVHCDFNPKALINLAPMTANNFASLGEILNNRSTLQELSEQPLLTHQPSLEPVKSFVREIIRQAISA